MTKQEDLTCPYHDGVCRNIEKVEKKTEAQDSRINGIYKLMVVMLGTAFLQIVVMILGLLLMNKIPIPGGP